MKGVEWNLKTAQQTKGVKSSAMVLVHLASKSVRYYQPWAEEPNVGDVFTALGVHASRSTELQKRADSMIRRMAKKQAFDEEKESEPLNQNQIGQQVV